MVCLELNLIPLSTRRDINFANSFNYHMFFLEPSTFSLNLLFWFLLVLASYVVLLRLIFSFHISLPGPGFLLSCFFPVFFWSSCSCRRPFFFPILLLLLILLMLLIILVLLLMLLQLPMVFLLLHVLLLFIYRALFSQFLQQSYNPLTLPPLLIPVFPMICQWSAHALPGLHACG